MTTAKTVKSILLGTAAALVAVAAAQAADMPVKAKPVQYVKICTLYGDGFYYIPGSDTCIKIGGQVQWNWGYNTQASNKELYAGTFGALDRSVATTSSRIRGQIAMDTRTGTQYGTLRAVAVATFQNQDQSESFNITRAYVQWAGFTLGRTFSPGDVPGLLALSFDVLHTIQNVRDTGENGINGVSYTFENVFGKGTQLVFGADERAAKSLVNMSNPAALAISAEPVTSYQGEKWPDLYVGVKANGEWGQWAATVFAHDVAATYYQGLQTTGACVQSSTATLTPLTTCGHPSDKIGFTVVSGLYLNLPGSSGGQAAKDGFGIYGAYSIGNSGNGAAGGSLSSPDMFGGGNNLAMGWNTDGVFVNGSQIELTTAWMGGAGYSHFWSDHFRSTFFGTYTQVKYDSTVVNSNWFCGGGGAAVQASVGVAASAGSCDPSFQYWVVGTNLYWYPLEGKNQFKIRIGIEPMYTHIGTAFSGQTLALSNKGANPVVGARPAGLYTAKDQDMISLVGRVRYFLEPGFRFGGG